jgi:hypothetical protein
VAEHDDETAVDPTVVDPTAVGDDLLREAERLRSGSVRPDPDPDPTTTWTGPTPTWTEPASTWTEPATAAPRLRDPGALLVGCWFAAAGLAAAILGEAHLDDVPPVIVPVSFAVVGLGLLLPKRAARAGGR